jgi:polar amino acid transport system substrate-binding protein
MARPRFATLAAATVFLLALLPAASRADAAKDELTPTGALRVAVAISTLGGPFWCALDTAGKPSGVPADLGAELARRLGVPVVYKTYANSGQITDAAARGEWDVTFVPTDAERAKKLAFGPIYNAEDATYIVRVGLPAQTAADLDRPDMRIAAVANTTTMRGAQRSLKNVTVTGYQSADEIVRLLSAGQIDAFANLRDQLVPLSKTLPGNGRSRRARTVLLAPSQPTA